MIQTSVILLTVLLMLAVLLARRGRESLPADAKRKPNRRASATARAIVKSRAPAKARAAPPAPAGALEWISPQAPGTAAAAPAEASARIRDRYISARFPGMADGAASLREIERVVDMARLYFEERKLDRALELLTLAVQESPGEKAPRLAQLEIAFLGHDTALFTILALGLRKAMPDCPEWNEVCRLGRALAPNDPLFGAGDSSTTHAHAHYGPWPDMPNWIHSSWDLTPEVLAADFHRALARRHEITDERALRRVA